MKIDKRYIDYVIEVYDVNKIYEDKTLVIKDGKLSVMIDGVPKTLPFTIELDSSIT